MKIKTPAYGELGHAVPLAATSLYCNEGWTTLTTVAARERKFNRNGEGGRGVFLALIPPPELGAH